ncbi:MAG TPA: hypothetical protein V6C69_11245 [Trichormus sp.]
MKATTSKNDFLGSNEGWHFESPCHHGTVSALLWVTEEINHSSLIVELTNQIDPDVLQRLAESPEATGGTLATLAFNPSREVRQAVADNPNTPVQTLMILAHDEDSDVRYQLAENHNVPDEILCILTADQNPFVSCRAEATLLRKASEVRLAA